MSLISNFKQLDTKQKVILIITVVAFLYVIYLGYDTFFAGDTGDNTLPTSQSTSVPAMQTETLSPSNSTNAPSNERVEEKSNKPNEQQSSPLNKTSNLALQESNLQANASKETDDKDDKSVIEAPSLEPTAEQLAQIAESQQLQQEYLRLVNQYQIVQLQERLEQSNAAIAEAKLKSAETAAKIQQINNQMRQQTGGNGIGGGGSLGGESSSEAQAQFASTLQLMYVGKKNGVWVAILNSNGSYFEVKVGTQLPDGSTVSSIDNRGVVLVQDGVKRYIAMPKSLNN